MLLSKLLKRCSSHSARWTNCFAHCFPRAFISNTIQFGVGGFASLEGGKMHYPRIKGKWEVMTQCCMIWEPLHHSCSITGLMLLCLCMCVCWLVGQTALFSSLWISPHTSFHTLALSLSRCENVSCFSSWITVWLIELYHRFTDLKLCAPEIWNRKKKRLLDHFLTDLLLLVHIIRGKCQRVADKITRAAIQKDIWDLSVCVCVFVKFLHISNEGEAH